ncbi:ThiF family adenylyltransferase [Paenibacillus sp. DMB5]|uniref:ThiF family adenylyltransferase n=1 Tax=Paenibacillus sp. DMB5 TaxID=1780103 RepID=UPI00076D2C7A|nr:ThiF family adenylyltransferase [Paenibacillus sp. DMB5]KUP23680.1 hypothetical protein AWJ19_09480 [Paenibacillus sp. DMB5]
MSRELINLSPDLKRLEDEGYNLDVRGAFALVHGVPYVNEDREIKYGTLISDLTLAGDRTTTPSSHVIFFAGEYPCNKHGQRLSFLEHTSHTEVVFENVIRNHSFSNKPPQGYKDYYEKFTQYINHLFTPVSALDKSVKVRNYENPIPSNHVSVFQYMDTNSARSHITPIAEKLANQRIAIVGLGGTGSYVLDFVSKTPVSEIHLFDGDAYLQHNAFRSPSAPSLNTLGSQYKKVDYFHMVYSNMHKGIIPHDYMLTEDNAEELLVADFVFIAIDHGESKKRLVDVLIRAGKPFVDCGIGVQIVNDSLIGHVRTTTCTYDKSDHVYERIPFNQGGNDAYSTNIQIAELNSLNASFAVIKWKKLLGFYQDLTKEMDATYELNTGGLAKRDFLD